jgi:hypothetical protein
MKFRAMPHRLTALAPRHHAAIRMKIDGAPGVAIAETLDVELRTVYLWMSDPLVKQELARQLERVNESFAQRLAIAALQGLEALRDLVEEPSERPVEPALKLRAACELLDRYDRIATCEPAASPASALAALSDEALVERARQILGVAVGLGEVAER